MEEAEAEVPQAIFKVLTQNQSQKKAKIYVMEIGISTHNTNLYEFRRLIWHMGTFIHEYQDLFLIYIFIYELPII